MPACWGCSLVALVTWPRLGCKGGSITMHSYAIRMIPLFRGAATGALLTRRRLVNYDLLCFCAGALVIEHAEHSAFCAAREGGGHGGCGSVLVRLRGGP